MSYEVTARKEVLSEYAASILATFFRYFREHNINTSDEKELNENPVVKKYWEIVDLKDKIFGSRYYRDLEGLKEVDRILRDANDYIEKLENDIK